MTDAQRVVLVVVAVLAIVMTFVIPPKVVHAGSGVTMTVSACRAATDPSHCEAITTTDGPNPLARLAALAIAGGAAFLVAKGRAPTPR